MKGLLGKIKFTKLSAIILSISILIGLFSFLIITNTAYGAGIVMGESTSITKQGAYGNDAGAPRINEVIFRVGISRDKDTYLEMKNGYNLVKNKFQQKIPTNENNTLYLLTQTLYDYIATNTNPDLRRVTIGWYAASTKTLHTVGKAEYLGRIKAIPDNNPPSPGSNGVYYSELKSYNLDTLENLANEEWKKLLTKKTEQQCLNAFGYIFYRNKSTNTFDIENRLAQFLNSSGLDTNNIADWTEAQQLEHKLRILDLLMMCYRLMPDNAEYKIDWENAIEDWITGANLTEKPVTIVIDTAAAINPGTPLNKSTGIILIGTIDFLNYVAGVETKYVLNSPFYKFVEPKVSNKSGINRTYHNILGSVQQSVNASPTFNRITNSYNQYNGFSHARSMLTKYSLYTTNNVAKWVDTSVLASYIDVLQVRDVNQAHEDVSGFMMVLTASVGKTSMDIKVQAKPDREIIETNAPKLGREVTVLVEPKLTSQQLSMIKPLVDVAKKNGKNIEVTYEIKRTYLGVTVDTQMSQTKKYTPDGFLALIQNGIETFIDIETADIDINGIDKVELTYDVTMTVKVEGKTIQSKGSDDASFIITLMSPKDSIYISTPTAYAEIKEGSPYNETFEAMAGVPSTEKLYFAAGGSEFIVDIKTSYVQDAKAERTYRSYYSGTDCEFKAGDTAGTFTLPTPSGATSYNIVVDAHKGGVVYATWTYTVKNNGVASELTGYNAGSAGSPCVGSGYNAGNPGDITWTNAWDADVYNDAVKNAKAWQEAVNKFIISHTSASDKKTRTWNNWNATLSGAVWGDSITIDQWESYTKQTGQKGYVIGYVEGCGHNCTKIWDEEPSEKNPSGKPHIHTHRCGTFIPATQTKVTKESDKTFTITVKATLPAHMVCGPCCTHTLPEVNDTWRQEVTFDYLKIDEVHIWKIDQASVNGMREITGTDEIKATIVSGDPNYFLNIAKTNTSKDGRIRYSVEPRQHDDVVWYEGVRTNKCDGLGDNGVSGGNGHESPWATGILYNNTSYPNEKDYEVKNSDDKDKQTAEYERFKSRRETSNKATIISDLLILQTSSGDQSVIYFAKDSVYVQTQENIPKVEATFDEMWTDNINSAANWTPHAINIGSYNGKYYSPTTKYEGNGGNKRVTTIFDNDPAGSIIRPSRPSKLFLYKSGINQIVTNVNKEYRTGDAEVFWKHMYSYPSAITAPYDTTYKSKYNANGYVKNAPYSDDTTKVNDIIVHTPVSAEYAIVVGLDSSRDQRIYDTIEHTGIADELNKAIQDSAICPRDPGLCEFRVLNCTYYDDVTVAMFTFENGLKNNITGKEYQLPQGFTIEDINRFGTGKSLSAKGIRWSIPLSDLGISYNPGTKLYIEADMYIPKPADNVGGPMIVSFYRYDFWVPGGYETPTWNTGNSWERKANVSITDRNIKLGLVFDFKNINNNKLYINGVEHTDYTRINESSPLTLDSIGTSLNIGSWGYDDNYRANFYLDNLKIVRLGNSSTHTDECYTPVAFHPSGNNRHVHSQDCLTTPEGSEIGIGAEWFAKELNSGNITKEQAREMLGDAYDLVVTESYGDLIHTWSNWSNTNMMGFTPLHQVTLSASNGDLVQNSSGNDPYFEVHVEFEANAVTKIEVVLDNNTSSTIAQLFWARNDISGNKYDENRSIKANMKPNTNNQTIEFIVKDNKEWKNTITYLRFDLGNTAGTIRVKKINVYGIGIKEHVDFDIYDGGEVIFESGTPGSYNVSIQPGRYKLQVWGAQGGTTGGTPGGKGGYSEGVLSVLSQTNMYIVIGGAGNGQSGGYNGGGDGGTGRKNNSGGGGGGATDIRIGSNTLYSRVIVAGGGGGAGGDGQGGSSSGNITPGTGGIPGVGGGLEGTAGQKGTSTSEQSGYGGSGGTQYSGGSGGTAVSTSYSYSDGTYYPAGGGGGGGGYYGGGGGAGGSRGYNGGYVYGGNGGNGTLGQGGVGGNGASYGSGYYSGSGGGGGAGSGYIGGVLNGRTITGNSSMPSPSSGTIIGKEGNGYAKVTKLLSIVKISSITLENPEVGQKIDFGFTGKPQSIVLPKGKYKLEVWGAEGASRGASGGKGGYSTGVLTLNNITNLYVYVGGGPTSGWNGGQPHPANFSLYSGGATDIRLIDGDWNNINGLLSRIIVAGGGGTAGTSGKPGGAGGGLSGESRSEYFGSGGGGGTQTAGGYGGGAGDGTFGAGGKGIYYANGYGGSGGGGWYGGGGVHPDGSVDDDRGGGGGSGYVLTATSYKPLGYIPTQEFYLDAATTIVGNQSMPSPDGSTVIGRSGNGYARITILEIEKPSLKFNVSADSIKENWDKIPYKLPNGTVNPLWACENYLGVSSEIGSALENAPVKRDTEVVTVIHPKTGKSVRAVKLLPNIDMPATWTKILGLEPNETYILEFDYWADADNVKFNVDIWPDDLPEIHPIAMKTVQHYRWEFTSSSNNMKKAIFRIFNDRTRPNPTNIYITNIKLVKKSYYNKHVCDEYCYVANVLNCNEPHHYGMHYDGSNDICWDACNNDANHAYYKKTVKDNNNNVISAGSFINLDYDFEIYFPNIGDFDQGQAYGLRTLTTQRGKGYVNGMDTTKWIRRKRVKFNFNVIYKGDGKLYLAGEWIELPVNASRYGFYCVLANNEAKSAEVQFEVEAINCPGNNDNIEAPSNKMRYSDYTAKHGGLQRSYIDIVGRIGNLVIDDTEDYRFSNFFKVPVASNDWIVDGVVKKVNETMQNLYFSRKTDIRGETIKASTNWLNTYGTQDWLNKEPIELPISPDKNNIVTLRNEPLRIGYNVLADISTIGNYQSKMQIVPYYYALNLVTNEIKYVDAYMLTNGEYKPINIYNAIKEGFDLTKIYDYILNLNWLAESGRRNYSILEKAHTDELAQIYQEYIYTPDAEGNLEVTGARPMDTPIGSYYPLGNAQLLVMSGKARTFIGSEYTNGVFRNIDNRIRPSDWWYAGQRWHFKLGLPSSTVFVEHGKPVNIEEINKISNRNHVILMTADIRAIGDVYTLKYTQPDNGIIKIGGKTYYLPGTLPPVIAVYSAEYTARHDIDIKGTH